DAVSRNDGRRPLFTTLPVPAGNGPSSNRPANPCCPARRAISRFWLPQGREMDGYALPLPASASEYRGGRYHRFFGWPFQAGAHLDSGRWAGIAFSIVPGTSPIVAAILGLPLGIRFGAGRTMVAPAGTLVWNRCRKTTTRPVGLWPRPPEARQSRRCSGRR